MKLERASGILLHPTSLPGGLLDEHAYRFVDWLAAAGQSWWQVLPLGPPDHTGSPVHVAVGVRRLARAARRPAGGGRARGGRGVPRAERLLDRRLAQARRPRSTTRSGSSANGARCARTRPSAASGSSATSRSTSRRTAPTTVAHPELFQPSGVAGVPPDAFSADGPAVGQPAVRLGRDARRRLPLVDRAAAPDVRARRPRAGRSLSRLRLVLGGAERQRDGRGADAGAAGRAPSSSGR